MNLVALHQADGSGDFDEEHFAEIMQYLNLDASEEHPASSKTRPSSVQNGSKQVPSQRMVANHQMSGQSLSLEDFVTLTFPLIDLEREAEIAQVILSISFSLCFFHCFFCPHSVKRYVFCRCTFL